MAIELPLHLKQLEPLTGALDSLRLLTQRSADEDTICDVLKLSTIAFGKVKRRLVTNGYVTMRSDGIFELTQKGRNASDELREYDENAPMLGAGANGKIQRRVLIAVSRTLIAGQPAPVMIGFAPDDTGLFPRDADVVLRLSALNAQLSVNGDQMIRPGSGIFRHEIQLTPQFFNQVRLKMQVFQLSADGEDISDCGGLFVDVDVEADGLPGNMIAYGAQLSFDVD
jgi:hypothetical protein